MTSFDIYLIKPTRYDDDGYPLQWWRSIVPSNSLACIAGIVNDAVERGVLPGAGEVRVFPLDEMNTKIEPSSIIRDIRRRGGKAFIGLIGVQSNQFPRAVDLGREFRAAGIPVCIGGFHVSGCLSMLKEMPPDLVEAQELGISFFAGEAEEDRIDDVLRDAYAGELKPVYNYLKSTPNIAGAPIPMLPAEQIAKNINRYSTFDLGRGCPFECSFCTIINVQGRKSRFRTPDDLERVVRENAALNVNRFLLTDDNFARNKNWEAFLDRLIELKAQGLRVRLAIQVDTLAHRINGFIKKCVKAGVDQVFIGLENINADNLEAVKKRQNRLEDYREMFLAWKKYPVIITCGYIIGFPNDTKESILKDIDILMQELPIDTLYLNYLTPLPGSEDHKKLYEAGVWMDPDMNKYDLNHRVTHHPKMSDAEWEEAFYEAHRRFYSYEHMETVLRRMAALGSTKKQSTLHRLLAYRESMRVEGVAKLEAGYLRIRRRKQRRPGMPIENPLAFYPWHWWRTASSTFSIFATYVRLRFILNRVMRDPERLAYRDLALTPASAESAHQMMAVARSTPYADRRREKAKLAS
jgi:uncharacterized radical SAM superfamily protein